MTDRRYVVDVAEDAAIVKLVRELRGLSQAELAEKVGVTEPTIRRLEGGDPRVKAATRARVAEELRLKFDWVQRRIIPPPDIPLEAFEHRNGKSFGKSAEQFLRDKGIDPEPQPRPSDELIASDAGVIVLGEVQAGGLVEPRVYDSGDEPERLPFAVPAARGAIALKIAGDSMTPDYPPGSYIICVPIDANDIEVNEDVVIQCGLGDDGRATFKKVADVDGDELVLKPINGKHKAVRCKRVDAVRVLRVLGTFMPKR